MTRALWYVLAGGVLVQIGCAGPAQSGPLRPAPSVVGAADAKPAVPQPVLLAAHPLSADRLSLHTPRTLRYITEKGERTVVQDSMPTCHCAGQTWWVRTYAGGRNEAAEREVRLVIDVNGSIAKAEEIDRVDNVEVVYTPPLALVPDKLPSKATHDAAFRQEGQMVVHPLGDRTKVRMRGTVKNEIVFEGDEMVRVGTSEHRAHRISATVSPDLGAAKTFAFSEVWLVDGIGVVVQRDREETRLLGAKVRDNASTMILQSFE